MFPINIPRDAAEAVHAPDWLIGFSKYVVKGGVILIDDYNLIDGATRATNDFLKNKSLKVQKISNHLTQVYIKI